MGQQRHGVAARWSFRTVLPLPCTGYLLTSATAAGACITIPTVPHLSNERQHKAREAVHAHGEGVQEYRLPGLLRGQEHPHPLRVRGAPRPCSDSWCNAKLHARCDAHSVVHALGALCVVRGVCGACRRPWCGSSSSKSKVCGSTHSLRLQFCVIGAVVSPFVVVVALHVWWWLIKCSDCVVFWVCEGERPRGLRPHFGGAHSAACFNDQRKRSCGKRCWFAASYVSTDHDADV